MESGICVAAHLLLKYCNRIANGGAYPINGSSVSCKISLKLVVYDRCQCHANKVEFQKKKAYSVEDKTITTLFQTAKYKFLKDLI
jgi:hypothetical protein